MISASICLCQWGIFTRERKHGRKRTKNMENVEQSGAEWIENLNDTTVREKISRGTLGYLKEMHCGIRRFKEHRYERGRLDDGDHCRISTF